MFTSGYENTETISSIVYSPRSFWVTKICLNILLQYILEDLSHLFHYPYKLISQSNNVRKITILRNRLFSLNSNNVTILESYHRFLEGFNLTHYQIPKDLSYLHLYKCLLSIFHEVVIWKNCCFTKWTINDLNAT